MPIYFYIIPNEWGASVQFLFIHNAGSLASRWLGGKELPFIEMAFTHIKSILGK